MGGAISSSHEPFDENIYTTHPQIGKYQYQYSCLNLSEEDIGKFFRKFKALDKNKNGTIESKELFGHFGIPKSHFASKVFNYYDIDNSGKIDFHEFVLVSWNFCTIDQKSIDKFIYALYDTEKNGELPFSMVSTITKDIYGREFKKNQNLQKALSTLQAQFATTMSFDDWIAFCARHSYLLYPVIIFQNELRTVLQGLKYWEDQTHYRNELCDQQYMPFERFLKKLLDGTLDPRYEKRTIRNKSPTIIMRSTQSPYFSNRRVHTFDDEPAPSSTALPPPDQVVGGGQQNDDDDELNPPKTPSSPLKEKPTRQGLTSPMTNKKLFPFAANSFLSVLSLRSSLNSSTSPPIEPISDPQPDSSPSPAAGGSSKKFEPPTLSRLPSDILKERRKQELIDRKSSRHKSTRARSQSSGSYSTLRSEGTDHEVEDLMKTHISKKKSKKKK